MEIFKTYTLVIFSPYMLLIVLADPRRAHEHPILAPRRQCSHGMCNTTARLQWEGSARTPIPATLGDIFGLPPRLAPVLEIVPLSCARNPDLYIFVPRAFGLPPRLAPVLETVPLSCARNPNLYLFVPWAFGPAPSRPRPRNSRKKAAIKTHHEK